MLKTIAVDGKLLSRSHSGIAQYYRPLLLFIMRAWPKTEFIFYNPGQMDESWLNGLRNYRIQRLPFVQSPINLLNDIIYGLVIFPWYLRACHAEVLISPYYDFWIPRRFNQRTIITIHDLCYWDLAQAYPWRLKIYHKLLLQHNIAKAAQIMTVSQFSLERIKHHFGQHLAAKTSIVYNVFDSWLNLAALNSDRAHGDLKKEGDLLMQRFGLKRKSWLLYTGGMEYRKNVPLMLCAFSMLLKKHPNYKLVFSGDHAHNSKLQRLIAKHGLADHIVLTGLMDDRQMQLLYSLCSGVLNLSLYEGFGRSNLESMASGAPLLCADIPINREIAGDYPIYCHSQNSKQIVQAMQQMIGQRNRFTAQTIPQHFLLADNASIFLDMLKKLATLQQTKLR